MTVSGFNVVLSHKLMIIYAALSFGPVHLTAWKFGCILLCILQNAWDCNQIQFLQIIFTVSPEQTKSNKIFFLANKKLNILTYVYTGN